MMRMRFFGKIIISLVVGITCASLWVQHDDRFLDIAHDTVVQVFRDSYNARFCAERCQLNPLSLSVTFNNIHVEPLDGSHAWNWSADYLMISCSVLSYLYSRVCGIAISLGNVQADTQIQDQRIAIVDHVIMILDAPKLEGPFDVNAFTLEEVKVSFNDPVYKINGTIYGSLSSVKNNNIFSTSVVLHGGSIVMNAKKIIHDLGGSVALASQVPDTFPTIVFDCSFISPQFPSDQRYTCYVKGSWDGQQGSCMLHTQDHSLIVHPCTVVKKNDAYEYKAKLSIDADLVKRLALPSLLDTVEGRCELAINGSNSGDVEGMCKVNQISYKGYVCDNVTFSFTKKLNDISGTVHADFGENALEGSVDYSLSQQQGTYVLENISKIPLYGYWELQPHAAKITGEFYSKKEQYLQYRATAYHTKTEEKVSVDGSLVQDNTHIILRGSIASQLYYVELQTDPFMVISGLYTDKDGNELIKGSFSDSSHFSATMHYETVRTIARSWYDSFLPGKGVCTLAGVLNEQGISGTLDLSNGLVRLPGMYNFISSGSMKYGYDIHKKLLIFDDVNLLLHKGIIKSKRLTLRIPTENEKLFIHFPLNFSHCFINIRKQLYGTFSGALLYYNRDDSAKVSGFCVVEDMNIKDNIFASELYNSLKSTSGGPSHKKNDTTSPSTQIAIAVNTLQPASITTQVLETKAQFNCFIKNTLEEPLFEGELSLHGGKIIFPAHTLHITRGKITFLPYLNNDHLLDIVAQGRIKKYLVTLMIGGSIQDPTITLQASPSLTQEQIMMLLFGGTEEQSLNVMAPALVMYNAQNFLFGQSSQYETMRNSLIPAWLRPFQRVNFIPRFADQTGRGGLKGVLEIEVNDRLRAAIEKNFSLSENASAEVEYLLSDDVSLKMNKDDRGDLGAEMEMRFKF